MSLKEIIFGRRLRSEEEESEQLGALAGIPVLGLDALASAAYGPEAALTVLIALGALASGYIIPITGIIIALLIIVAMSYRQTIPAYPWWRWFIYGSKGQLRVCRRAVCCERFVH